MATQEKLLKSLESLRQLIASNQTTDAQSKKKEKIQHCNFVAEAMLNPTIKIAKNFNSLLSYTMEVLLQMCDDQESDVRMTVDECLNRIIRAMSNGSITKVQIELHKEIKHNGPARSLRAALLRFALLAHHIRPHKGKPYVVNLIPCIIKILERNEELVHETLAIAMPKILSALGCFTMDNDIKSLLKACLANIHSSSAVIRRTTASCILTICMNCRKPYIFITYVLNNLIDNLVPVQDTHSTALILGVMGCLKTILPNLSSAEDNLKTQSGFGARKDISDKMLSVERLLQIYELCLHYSTHSDHNIINASLETLNVLLQNAPGDLKASLLSTKGLMKSRIALFETCSKAKLRSPSQLSVATTLISEDNFLLESDLCDTLRTDIEKWIDESKLSVINVNYIKSNEEQTNYVETTDSNARNTNEVDKAYDYSNISIGTIQDQYTESIRSENFMEPIDKVIFSENSSEKSFSQKIDDKSNDTDLFYLDVDIGDYLDKSPALIYCTRHISKQFLLSGMTNTTISDKTVRVSTKNLALTCLSTIIQIYPDVLLMYLDKNSAKADAKESKQQISDILIYDAHCDPQLRGIVHTIISSFIKSVLLQNAGNYNEWILKVAEVEECDVFEMKNLIRIILNGLQDKSSVCSRQTLVSLNICFTYLLESEYSLEALPILNYLPILASDLYWLVKVKLVEIITDLPYVTIQHVFNSNFQNKVIHNILLALLGDEDQRVRTAATNAIIRIIPVMYFEQNFPNETPITCKAIHYKNMYMPSVRHNGVDANTAKKQFINNMPFPFDSVMNERLDITEDSLSRIVSKLFRYLLESTSKHHILGCIETLSSLSCTYPTTLYKTAWGCFKSVNLTYDFQIFQRSTSMMATTPTTIQESLLTTSEDLLNVTVNLLQFGIIGYDLNCHINLLKLAGNIFAGKWLENMKPSTDVPLDSPRELWDLFTDKKLSDLSEHFLNHVIKVLNIFAHVLDEVTPVLPQTKQVLPNLPSASNLSPIKRKKSDAGEKRILSPGKIPEKDADKKLDVKINAMGYFANVPHYMKIYEILRIAYNNYKVTLDLDASENFLNLLRITLQTLSQILEVATLTETGRIADEILLYLRSTFALEATTTVKCVQQLLKSLFGTNLSTDIDDITKYLSNTATVQQSIDSSGFYYHIAQLPLNDISNCINSLNKVSKIECDGDSIVMGYLHRKENKKGPNRNMDKILANYIRIFEPLVIKSLKHYTITSDVKLQCQVLGLLSQLVQLRVNYCLLDSEQIFIGFVLKQFEFIEEGQIPLADKLIPKIFQFLVHLSYGKQHSKSIIVIPKIIQLCDGLMASGQSPTTHCIPALKPIVEDVFLARNKSNTPDFKELETTREVLVSMLLRLIEYYEVIDLIVLILNESKYYDNSERWPRWSKQVFDVFLPLLRHNKLRLDEMVCMEAVRRLIFALHPSIFKFINEILIVLFGEPPNKDDPFIHRYISKITILLLILSQVKEDKLLIKIIENQSDFSPQCVFQNITITPDPLNVTKTNDVFDKISPEVIFLRFIFRIIDSLVEKCVIVATTNEDSYFIVQQFSCFLLHCLHIFQSGLYPKITSIAVSLINDVVDFTEDEKLPFNKINENFIKLRFFHPLLTFQWCYILTLLDYNNRNFWARIMQIPEVYGIEQFFRKNDLVQKRQCINLEIVRVGGSIVFCDYLCENVLSDGEQMSWLLVNNIDLILNFHNETPIYELLGSIHRNSACSGLVIQAVATKCADNVDPTYRKKLLKCIENVHPSQTGTLLLILIPKLLNTRQLAISRLVANLASRKIEYLLTLSGEDIVKQLPKNDLIRIMDLLISMKLVKKHETLVSLLNKLASQFYDLSPLEFDQRRSINPECIKKINIDKTWYLSQVKLRCHNIKIGAEAPELLSKLSYEDLIAIMSHKDFNKAILYDCIKWCVGKRKSRNGEEELTLVKGCFSILTKDVANIRGIIPKPHQVFRPEGRSLVPSENKYNTRMSEIISDEYFWQYLQSTIPPITSHIKSLQTFPELKISDSHYEDYAKLAVICLESVTYTLNVNKSKFNIAFINTCLNCSEVILKETYLCSILGLDTHATWLCSAINSLYKLVSDLLYDSEPLPSLGLNSLLETVNDVETRAAGHATYQLSVLISWLERINGKEVNVPDVLLKNISSIVISLARLPLVNSYVLTPPTAWKSGWGPCLYGPFRTQVPPLPVEYFQEVEILEEFIYRITLLGWTSRQQFEEMWMCLLSVLSTSPNENSLPEEINAITHSTSLAVQAITSLLLQTLYHPQPGNKNISELLHVPRDGRLDETRTSVKKLKNLHRNLSLTLHEHWKTFDKLYIDVFNKPNLEKQDNNYSYSQLSVEYLLIATKAVEILDEKSMAARVFYRREQILCDIGLDLNSCLQFLLDLYSQWLKSEEPLTLRLLHEVVKSILSISDLFSEKSQFQWMLEVCSDLSKTHMPEDEVIHQYLVLGICKATAVLTPDMETYEFAKKIITQSLKSVFLTARVASLHGLLYILQVCVLGNTVIGGVSEELQIFLPVAVEYILCHINCNNGVLNQSQEHTLLLWALAFYVIENIDFPNLEVDFVESVLSAVLVILSDLKVNTSIHIPLIKAVERLLIKKRLPTKINNRILKFALEKLRNANPIYALPAAQLLYTSMYIEYSEQLENTEKSKGVVQSNPDHLVQTIEKISAVFDKIKRGYPFEVEILCSSLPDVLNDFFPPSDILTKVISEYLSPQQRHPMQLSRVVFQIFENTIQQSQLSLLQDWVVFSLTNFTQSFSIGMATWCLTCFFISASTNVWLRNMFPYVQKRVGRYEYEDRKILCIAGADFYNNLNTDVQKKTFVDTLLRVKDQVDMPFNELLGCL